MATDVSKDPFAGEGEMPALCRAMEWDRTPLGPVESWSATLRSMVRATLASPMPICLWCGDELILLYNDGYRAVLGDKHPEALGRPGSEVWSEIWDQTSPLFEQIRAGGPPVYAEDAPFLVKRRGGDETRPPSEGPNAWFTFALSPIRDADGELVAHFNVVTETTGRVLAEREREAARARAERAEARLLDIFAQAPAFIAVLRGPDHVFEYVNETYYDVVGQRELIGRPVLEALPEVRGQGVKALLDGVLESGEAFVGREWPIELARTQSAESEKRYIDFVYYPITELDGTISGVVAHGSDVTDHVLARQEAQSARAEAEDANRAKSRFLATMSHELRTPINAVLGYTELLSMGLPGPINEAQATQLERVRASTRHLLMLIDDILDLTQVEAGRIEVKSDKGLVADAVAAAVSLVLPQAESQGIRIENTCEREDGPHYLGDEDRVRQILVNLLSNAVKFTEPGGAVRITCGTSSASAPARERAVWIEEAAGATAGAAAEAESGLHDAAGGAGDEQLTYIRVSDSGVGIAREELDRIFLPFTQVERGYSHAHGGAGLGLAISLQLADLMDGDLTVRSEVEEGSTFTLWLRR